MTYAHPDLHQPVQVMKRTFVGLDDGIIILDRTQREEVKILRSQEVLSDHLYFHLKEGHATPPQGVHKLGKVGIYWHILHHRPLQLSDGTRPLLVLPQYTAEETYNHFIDVYHDTYPTAYTLLDLPQVSSTQQRPSLRCSLHLPVQVEMLSVFDLTLRLVNPLGSRERCSLVVYLSEGFLLCGSTFTNIEVSCVLC
jgi:hypothetical protein